MNENELMHHGVKGMKWGQRKDRKKSSNSYERRISKYDQENQKLISKHAKSSKRNPDRLITSRAVAGKIRKNNRIINNNKRALRRINKKRNDDVSDANLTKKQKDLIDKSSKTTIPELALTSIYAMDITKSMGPFLGVSYALASSYTRKNRKKKNYMYRSGMYDL